MSADEIRVETVFVGENGEVRVEPHFAGSEGLQVPIVEPIRVFEDASTLDAIQTVSLTALRFFPAMMQKVVLALLKEREAQEALLEKADGALRELLYNRTNRECGQRGYEVWCEIRVRKGA